MKNQRGAGFVLSYISIFISSVIGIAFTPYMITALGKNDYGLYQLIHSAIGYFALLDFGLGSTLTRYIIKYKAENKPEKVDSAISICIRIYSGIGILVIILSSVASIWLDKIFIGSVNSSNIKDARLLLIVMGITTGISFLRHAFSGIHSAGERYVYKKGVLIAQHCLRVVVIFVFLQMGMGAVSVSVADLIIVSALAIYDAFYCRVKMKCRLLAGKWDTPLFKSLFSFSFFVFLQIIVTNINNGLDRVLLGVLSTLEVVALYGVAMQLYSLFNSFGGVVSGITLPKISSVVFSGASDEEITDCCAKYSRYQLHILAPILGGFIAFGRHFISIWTPEYDATQLYIIVLLIVVPQILEAVEGTIFNVMKAKNLQATRSIILIAVAVCHIILSVILIKFSSIYGAALGTFISFVIGNNILSNIYYHKKIGINIFRYFKKLFKGILPVFIITLVIGVAINLIPVSGWVGFVIKGFLFVVVYGILIYVFGIDNQERALFKGLLNKAIKKLRR